MSFVSGTQMEEIWAGPSVSYAAQAAASSSPQFLFPGVSGAYEQPFIPANFWQMGRRNQRAHIEVAGLLTGQATATTAIWTVGLATAPNTATPGTGGGPLCATGLATVTSFSGGGWRLKADILTRNVGYGTGAVSTSLLTDGEVSASTPLAASGVTAAAPPTLLSTIDCSAQWWLYATVTFSTASATNSCQVTRTEIWGQN
jgi:hypothetical protein